MNAINDSLKKKKKTTTTSEAQLTFAGNRDIAPEVVSYLQEVWDKLQGISTLQFDSAGVELDTTTTTSPPTLSPTRIPNPAHYDKITALTRELAEEVLAFCFPRLQAWFDKFWSGVEEPALAFTSNPLSNETDGSDFLDLLRRLSTVYN